MDLYDPSDTRRVYSWLIVAYDKDNKKLFYSDKAKFKVVDTQTMQQLNRYANMPLLQGLLYVKAGVREEAEKKLNQELISNPRWPQSGASTLAASVF